MSRGSAEHTWLEAIVADLVPYSQPNTPEAIARVADLWEQQIESGETSKAFAAFVTYRNLPPSQRSIDTAWRNTLSVQLAPDDPRRQHLSDHRAPKTWHDWSVNHDWVARSTAWDAEKDRQSRDRQLAEHQAMLDRHIVLAEAMLAKGVAGLEHLTIADLEARDVIPMIRFGVDIERRSRLLPELVTVVHSGQVGVEANVSGVNYDTLVELLLHAPAEAILNADRLSGRLASDAGLLGRKSDEAPREGGVETRTTP